jgi:HTH-like domain
VTWAIREKNYSQRRACALIGLHPKTYRYGSRRPADDAIRKQLRDLASQCRRFGYRRFGLLLAREGIELNHKKLYRLYREERLTVCKRGGRKRALETRAPIVVPQGRNLRWSLDFAAYALLDSRRFRILVVVDDFTRECLALVAYPARVLGDSAYGSAEMLGWLVYEHGIEPHVTVFDKSARKVGTFSREDFHYDHERDVYLCPGGKMLTTTGTRVNDDATLLYRASKADCEGCSLKPRLSEGRRPARCLA